MSCWLCPLFGQLMRLAVPVPVGELPLLQCRSCAQWWQDQAAWCCWQLHQVPSCPGPGAKICIIFFSQYFIKFIICKSSFQLFFLENFKWFLTPEFVQKIVFLSELGSKFAWILIMWGLVDPYLNGTLCRSTRRPGGSTNFYSWNGGFWCVAKCPRGVNGMNYKSCCCAGV